jgi:RNA-binding protein NOB1
VLGGDRVWEDVNEEISKDGVAETGQDEPIPVPVRRPAESSTTAAPEEERPSLIDSYPAPRRLQPAPAAPIYALDDLPASDDEGDWITPTTVSHQKSLDMGLIPSIPATTTNSSTTVATTPGAKVKGPKHVPQLKAACMTGDFAVQNVLLQMGLNLVGEGGKRIGMVKSWVLRCHACFK